MSRLFMAAAATSRLRSEGLAAAAARLLVGILEDETALQLVLLVIHLGADQEHHGSRIDEDRHALVLDDVLELLLLVGIFDEIAEPGAAARLHPDAQALHRLVGTRHQLLHPRSGSFGNRDHRRGHYSCSPTPLTTCRARPC